MSTDTIFGFPVQVCDTLPHSGVRLVSDGEVLRLINVQDPHFKQEDSMSEKQDETRARETWNLWNMTGPDAAQWEDLEETDRNRWRKMLLAAPTPEAAGRGDEGRWIPCTERLPNKETPVLIVLRGRVRIGERRWEHPTHEETFRAFWYWDDPENDGQDWATHDVTSWRPIPSPPSLHPTGDSETARHNT